jgi:hypothetical protein
MADPMAVGVVKLPVASEIWAVKIRPVVTKPLLLKVIAKVFAAHTGAVASTLLVVICWPNNRVKHTKAKQTKSSRCFMGQKIKHKNLQGYKRLQVFVGSHKSISINIHLH